MSKTLVPLGAMLVGFLILSGSQLVTVTIRTDSDGLLTSETRTTQVGRTALGGQPTRVPLGQSEATGPAQAVPAGNTEPRAIAGGIVEAWKRQDSFTATANIATSANGMTSQWRAQLQFAAPNNVHLEALGAADGVAEGDTVVFDGKTLWVYSPGQNQVTVIKGLANVLLVGQATTPMVA
ncbi:MAG: hypothetical protein M0Z94_09255, partial [Dehalococcoidales bacterium]|nr:hypothetical protein [Dehalococcoidales bacterium]